MELPLREEDIWLHIAPVDRAGNFGPTIHVNLNPFVWNAAWKLYTEPLEILSAESVYRTDVGKPYYVKCDGKTPFTVEYGAWMAGTPYVGYRLNQAVFEHNVAGEKATASNCICLNEQDEVAYFVSQKSALSFGTYTKAQRLQEERRLQVSQQFVLGEEADGKALQIIPRAAAGNEKQITYSEYTEDVTNGVTIIGDGTAPVIIGLEPLEELSRIVPGKEPVPLELRAEDTLSGVAEFYLEVENHDNGITKKMVADETASLSLYFSEDEPVFSGDFTIKAWAKDCVGNVRELFYDTMGFSLEAEITRILSPHEPVFRKGESGILTVRVWGYPDKVEVLFPEEMTQGDEVWMHSFDYREVPRYKQEEKLQFMIPLKMEDAQELKVIVRAYKGDKKLEEYPTMAILNVEGSILEDIRTRLR